MDLNDESFPKDYLETSPAVIGHRQQASTLYNQEINESNLKPIRVSKFKAKSCQNLDLGTSNKYKHVESRVKSVIMKNSVSGKVQKRKKFRRFNSMPESLPESDGMIEFENINSSEERETNFIVKDSQIDMLQTKVAMYERYFHEELEKNAKLEEKIDLMRRESKNESNLMSIPEFHVNSVENVTPSPCKSITVRRRVCCRKFGNTSTYERFDNENEEEITVFNSTIHGSCELKDKKKKKRKRFRTFSKRILHCLLKCCSCDGDISARRTDQRNPLPFNYSVDHDISAFANRVFDSAYNSE